MPRTDLNCTYIASFSLMLIKFTSFQEYPLLNFANLTTYSDPPYLTMYDTPMEKIIYNWVNDFAKLDVLLTLKPVSDIRFGLSDTDYLRSDQVPVINDQELLNHYSWNLIGLGQTDTHTDKLWIFRANFSHITLSFRKGN